MAMKRHRAEQIVAKLRQIEVLTAQGKVLAAACKEAAVSEQTYYRWRKEYGGLKLEQAKKFYEWALTPGAQQAFSPMLAILSAQHEVQYSRLFRS